MRVIWISVFLFVVLVAAGISLYEPDDDVAPSAAVEKPLENPFADEQPADKEVNLPELPQNSPQVANNGDTGANVQPATGFTPAVPSDESRPLDEQAQPSPAEIANATISSESASSSESAGSNESTSAENLVQVDSVVEPGQGSEDPAKTKKPGLAMLELEKENKRNKVAVIVHQDNPQQLTAADIRAMYLDRMTRWQDGATVMLYNLPLGDIHREKFSQSILNMSALEADSAEAQRRELHINVNPVEVKAKNIVVAYVEQHPNAVAYVPLVLVRDKSNVKIVMTIP